jgi:glycosyltransferase involved in cell wall biosynthesis
MDTQLDQRPLLSITILNYNYAHYLSTCLDSILSQDFKDFEIILINDTSTDNSLNVIKPYLEDTRIRLIDHEVNKGFVASLIEGSEASRGKYITVISADDWILDLSAFRKQIAILEQDADIAFVYSSYGHFETPDKCDFVWRASDRDYVLDGLDAFRNLIVNPFLLHSGTIIRKTAYHTIGGYETTYSHLVDTRMWLSLCHVGKVAYISDTLYAYRRHGSNMSKNPQSFRRHLEEALQTIDWSFGKLTIDQQKELAWLKNKAVRKTLMAFPIDDIFRNHYRNGWICFWAALKLRPTQTLFQKMTLLITLRTILGRNGYQALEILKAKLSTKTRLRLVVNASEHRST